MAIQGLKARSVLAAINQNVVSKTSRCCFFIPGSPARQSSGGNAFLAIRLLKFDFTGETPFFGEHSLKNIDLIKGLDAIHASRGPSSFKWAFLFLSLHGVVIEGS